MAFCQKCGKEIVDNEILCPYCDTLTAYGIESSHTYWQPWKKWQFWFVFLSLPLTIYGLFFGPTADSFSNLEVGFASAVLMVIVYEALDIR